jgi:hypothetical protein
MVCSYNKLYKIINKYIKEDIKYKEGNCIDINNKETYYSYPCPFLTKKEFNKVTNQFI